MRLRIRLRPGVLVAVSVTLTIAAFTGCEKPTVPRLNAPPQGEAQDHPSVSNYFVYHDDQGMLADMSIADIHFVPHTAQLSGVGEARLERYAELLAGTGGCIHYDTGLQDQTLIEARLVTARSFVKDALPSGKTIELAVGLPGGRGMSAKEAKGGRGVAEQAEARESAYYLQPFMQNGSGGGVSESKGGSSGDTSGGSSGGSK
jgi:hypothetical protein